MSDQAQAPRVIASRYMLHDRLGRGGMGMVFRSTDRLTGETVALKRVMIPSDAIEHGSSIGLAVGKTSSGEFRLALAREFRTLSSLHHPNIISVLDYGFDDEGQPFYTMEFLDEADNLLQAGKSIDEAGKVGMLVQVLQALAYLHRRGIVHRDLKPDNILVAGEEVKVLDFGLAVARDRIQQESGGTSMAGTLAYMSPEVLRNSEATPLSDLYTVGVLAYELFSGYHPFNVENSSRMITEIIQAPPDIERLQVTGPLGLVIERLLAKDPQERYPNARAAMLAMADAINRYDLIRETRSVRESFIRSATFVGRQLEFRVLSSSLARAATERSGSGWLISGQSGVGKTRLVEELRTLALTQGVLVLRGQATRQGGRLFGMWREALRRLLLSTPISDEDALTLKTIIPDIDALIGRTLPEAAELSAEAGRDQLLEAASGLFLRQQHPVLVILEDLQWASESLDLLNRLLPAISNLPLMAVGTFRTDERPDLPQEVPDAIVLPLSPLRRAEIAELSASMLGTAGSQERVVDLIEKEAAGNVFFMVEVVRALAEEAGHLDQVGAVTLPQSVFASGIATVLQRRLSRIPEEHGPLLEVAAVAGRTINLELLEHIAPDTDLRTWLNDCADAAVLTVLAGTWQFAHEKLREGLLVNLDDERRKLLHRQVAEALQATLPDPRQRAADLAYHWRHAGDEAMEARWSLITGLESVAGGAHTDAILHLRQAQAIFERTGIMKPQQMARLSQHLAQAYAGVGRQRESQAEALHTLKLLAYDAPSTPQEVRRRLPVEALRQVWHRFKIDLFGRMPRGKQPYHDVSAIRAAEQLAQYHFFNANRVEAMFFALAGLNIAEGMPQGAKPERARFYASIGMAAGALGRRRMAERYIHRARDTLADEPDSASAAYIEQVWALYLLGQADWEPFYARIETCVETARQVGHWRRRAEGMWVRALADIYRGEWASADQTLESLSGAAARQGDLQYQTWSALGQGITAFYRGRLNKARSYATAAEETLEASYDRTNAARIFGLQAHIHTARSNMEMADEYAQKAFERQALPTSPGMLLAFTGPADFTLTIFEMAPTTNNRDDADETLKGMRAFARTFPVAYPTYLGYASWFALVRGQENRGRRLGQRAIELASAMSQPYAEGRAHLHLARLLPTGDPDRLEHLRRAINLFTGLGASYDLNVARDLLDG